MRPALSLLLGAAAACAMSGFASAQAPQDATLDTTIQVLLQPLPGPILPGSEAVILGEVTYTVQASPPGPVLPKTRVTLRVLDAPDWAVVAFDEEELEFQPGAVIDVGPVSQTQQFQARVRVAGEPPAFVPEPVRIGAEAEANLPYKRAEGEDTTLLVVDYLPRLKVSAEPTRVRLDSEGKGELTLIVANNGNARSRIQVSILEAPQGVRVRATDGFHLDSAYDGSDHRREVPVEIFASDTFEGDARLVLGVWAEHALDPKLRGPPVRVAVTLERAPPLGLQTITKEASETTWGPAVAFGTLGALGGAALRRFNPRGPYP